MTIREQEDRIFRNYRTSGQLIIRDGALGKEYESARVRLLVILKEPNDEKKGFAASGGDIRDFGRMYARSATWRNLARWSALAENPHIRFEEIDVTDIEERRMHLRRLAVVNLKKTSGKSTSHYNDIEKAATQNWELLQKQLRLYKPDVTITANVFAIVRDLMRRDEQTDNRKCFPYFKDSDLGVCFDFYHPQQRTYPNKDIFNLLKRELKYHKII